MDINYQIKVNVLWVARRSVLAREQPYNLLALARAETNTFYLGRLQQHGLYTIIIATSDRRLTVIHAVAITIVACRH